MPVSVALLKISGMKGNWYCTYLNTATVPTQILSAVAFSNNFPISLEAIFTYFILYIMSDWTTNKRLGV